MAGVIDSLLIVLGFDTSGLTQGQKDVDSVTQRMKDSATRSGKAIEESADRASKSVEALGRKFLGLYALVTGGEELKAFVSNMTSADAALGRTARNVDMSARSLSTWQGAAEAAGGSAEGITGTISSLSSAMQEAALTGNNRLAPVMRALGVNLADTGGHARNVGDVLTDLNRRYNAMHIDPARFASMMHMIGVDDGTINLLERSTTEFDKLMKEQEKYAATSADVDAAQKRQSGWRELLLTSQSLGRSILTALTPAITGAMKAVQQWANANQAWIRTAIVEKIGQFVDYLRGLDWKSISDGFQGFIGNVQSIATAVAGAVKGIDSNSPLYKGLEALAVLAGTRLALAFTGLTSAIGGLSAVSLPGWFVKLSGLTGAVALGASAESTPDAETQKRQADFYKQNPDAPKTVFGMIANWWKDNASKGLGGEGAKAGDREAELERQRAAQRAAEEKAGARPSTGSWWGDIKRLVGLGDDPKVKDGIADTAKATGEIRDLLKRQADGLGGDVSGAATGGGVLGAAHRALGWAGRAAGYSPATGGGRTPAKGALAANQREAYATALKEGLSATAARALVANMSGESLANPKDYHWDGTHYSGGIVQWDPQRSAAIKAKFGDVPWKLSVADQTRAAIWEYRTNSRFAATKRAMEGDNAADMIGALVDNYESPANRARAKAQRMGYYRGFNPADPGAKPKEPTVTVNGTPSHADAPVTDDVYAAAKRVAEQAKHVDPKTMTADQRRAVAMTGDIIKRYEGAHRRTYETHGKPLPAYMSPGADGPITTVDHRDPRFAPHALDVAHQKLADAMRAAVAPTVGHAVHAALHAMAHANHLLQHGDRPVQVEDKSAFKLQERTFGAFVGWGKRHPEHLDQARAIAHGRAASLAAMTRMADAGRYSLTQHANNSHTEHHIHGDINVQTRATDAKGIAGDLGPYLFQGSDARQANRGLA